MKLKVDKGLLPIKAHFFFFFAALGPLLPQMNVFGRQLGVSAGAMGLVTAVLPLLWAAAKPLFGYLVDYFTNQRKLIFMLLILTMTGSYCSLWLLPMPLEEQHIDQETYHLNDTVLLQTYSNQTLTEKFTCHWNCSEQTLSMYLPNATSVNTIYVERDNISCSLFHMDFVSEQAGRVVCAPRADCVLFCYEDLSERVKVNDSSVNDSSVSELSFYATATFWLFVVFMCVGTVAFNVANCIGDAVCFDVLGPDRAPRYGAQRAWGTIGYGVTALLGGWLVDRASPSGYKDFTPAFALAAVFTVADLVSCRALKLPSLSTPADSGKALREVLRMPRVVVFIIFAVVAGTFDSFIIYYMFWFLEEVAEQTGHLPNIKLIEGIVVAGECLVGELVFFSLSGKILKRWGYGKTMSVSLLCYGLRLALISVITNPWQLVVVESILQGPTYALCYSCIVGYAAKVAPEGYSATVQGVVAGMDDGVGFAVGSLLGGQLYSHLGARAAFRAMAGAAVLAAIAHATLFRIVCRETGEVKQTQEMTSPEEGEKMLPSNAIYRETVVPLNEKNDDLR